MATKHVKVDCFFPFSNLFFSFLFFLKLLSLLILCTNRVEFVLSLREGSFRSVSSFLCIFWANYKRGKAKLSLAKWIAECLWQKSMSSLLSGTSGRLSTLWPTHGPTPVLSLIWVIWPMKTDINITDIRSYHTSKTIVLRSKWIFLWWFHKSKMTKKKGSVPKNLSLNQKYIPLDKLQHSTVC